MKELSIEDKALRYDEALEMARKLKDEYNDIEGCYPNQWLCEKLFPELKESEDERIGNLIYCLIRDRSDNGKLLEANGCSVEKALSWLEKQKEQKPVKFDFLNDFGFAENGYDPMNVLMTIKRKWPMVWEKMLYQEQKPVEWGEEDEQKSTDKVKPKFKVGDWVVDKQGLYHQIERVIENITNHTYGYDIVGGGYFNDNTEDVRLWTIQDAKDGDVLVYGDNPNGHHVEVIMIFKSLRNEKSAFTHFHIFNDKFRIDDWSDCGKNVHPATKEQRDILFSKMKESGYVWDAEKKELKKIKQNPSIKLELDENGEPVLTPFEAELFSMMSEAWQHYAFGKEINIAEIVKEHSADLVALAHNQQPIMWSEEDEEMLKWLCRIVHSQRVHKVITLKEESELGGWMDKWLNHNPQSHWKPSDEQMAALESATENCAYSEYQDCLRELIEQLKKLKGE